MNIADKEIEQLKKWEKDKAYDKVNNKNKEGEEWYFCDGPPYATGQMHPGTAYNKCAKDAILRYKRWRGYNVLARAGYDTHGLPIEVKVEKDLGVKHKNDIEKIGVEKFIKKCKEFATEHLSKMSKDFIRAGVWMDFDDPYLTYTREYIEPVWGAIKKINDNGLLYRGSSVLPYCPRCETPLANYELEYSMIKSPSIFVKFKVKDTENEYLIIWTTTPWTLVANMAVMVHPSETYVKVKPDDKDEVWIIAKARMEHLSELLNINLTVLSEMSGKRIDGTKYESPLGVRPEVERRVVLSDEYVTMDEGSGLVHCAPGHGPEDYIIGKRYDIEPFSPVDDNGNFTEAAGKYKGKNVLEINDEIINELKDKGILLHSGTIEHRYPHCWRCKTPLIFRTTKQWFAKISDVKEKMIDEIDKVNWIPDFARTRFSDFVSNAPDWCISRQRYWGIPIPIWVNEDDETDYIVLGSFDELPEEIEDVHRPYVDKVIIEKDGKKYKRVPDVLDVWIDSGNAVWSGLHPELRKEKNKTQFIIEGKDQTRGWFYSLLGMGVMTQGYAPYESIMMHGFFVDEKGEKMSKSMGNFIPFDEIVEKYGADAFRVWALSSVPWNDLVFSWGGIKEAYSFVNTVDNIAVYLKRFADDVPYETPIVNELTNIEDRWLISKFNQTLKKCEEEYDKYHFHTASREIVKFILDDISRFYMKLIKSRNDKDGLKVLKYIFIESLKMLNPIAPFVTERAYANIIPNHKETICLEDWPAPIGVADNTLLSDMEIIKEIFPEIISARHKIGIKLRWPIDTVKIYPYDDIVSTAVERLSNIIKVMANIHSVETVKEPLGKIKIQYDSSLPKEEIEKIDHLVKENMYELEKKLNVGKSVTIEDKKISPEYITIKEEADDYYVNYFSGGKIYVHTKLPKDVIEEGIAREVIRRLQSMRKELKLIEKDKINVIYSADDDVTKAIDKFKDMITTKVNAVKFDKGKPKGNEWKIQGIKNEYIFKAEIQKI